MKNALLPLLLLCIPFLLRAQTAAAADTTVYEFAESMPYPLLVSCQAERHPGWNQDSVRRCGELQLLGMLIRNIQYPAEAREKNLEGTVVASFIVEKDGRMSRLGLLKDIGGGCGAEALRVLSALDQAGLRWQPARHEGKPVRMKHSLPLRFKLQEALPYYITEEGDTLYAVFDRPAGFTGGTDSLVTFVVNELEYPAEELDSCRTGIIEMALIVGPDGAVKVFNQLDFNNLGYDYQWNALRLAAHTAGRWQPATYEGRPVASTYPLRVVFKSPRARCAAANTRFDQAMLLADEAAALLEENQPEAALAKMTEALRLQPGNTELLYYRGTALLNTDKRDLACKDYNRVKEILGITWFEEVRRLVCGW